MGREHLSSRLGFILITAGCSIGLGNVWRFPYITGQYGGATFVILYILFLAFLSLPIVVMEFAVGRASQQSTARSFDLLEPPGTPWHWFKYVCLAGNYLLMMFYTVITGWLIWYFWEMLAGGFQGLKTTGIADQFLYLLDSPGIMTVCTFITLALSFGVCSIGLQKGAERVTKFMMIVLFLLLIVLAINSIMLPGAEKGLEYYLKPNLDNMKEAGLSECIFAAMGQAFFTLSVGIGSLSVFGSRINKTSSLTSNALYMGILDTFVAFLSGLIIFPACFSFGVQPNSGPELLFITLPNIFNSMSSGWLWGSLFFLFMCFAALTTVIAVIENIITFCMDLTGCSRIKAVIYNFVFLSILTIPCILGFNVWRGVRPFGGDSTILDLEDFIVSNHLLPLGSLVFLFFCTSKYGWGWINFQREASTGKGLAYPQFMRGYVTYVLPIIIILIFIGGYLVKF